jgi:hypothetical protein
MNITAIPTPNGLEPFTVMRTEDNFIRTYTGKKFWPLNPVVTDICIEDIAHALAFECRFAGHCNRFYSVADHSIRVSHEVERRAMQDHRSHEALIQVIELAMWGLLHDASEAYLKDMPSPIKRAPQIGTVYKQYEGNLMDAIALRFDLMPIEPAIVRDVDRTLCHTEMRDLMNGSVVRGTPLEETIFPRTSFDARRDFLARYTQLEFRRSMYKAVRP